MKVLVTGATGYIGGRLIPLLVERGYAVRVLVRDIRRISRRPWLGDVEVVVADASQPHRMKQALQGVDAAFYLIHSMNIGRDFIEHDRIAAQTFADAATHLKHVIYLGGLVPTSHKMSRHLASRLEVGEIIREKVPATEFRAGPIIGSGSASFEMMRYLVQRLPILILPPGMHHEVQPVGIRSVLQYLVEALDKEPLGVVEIGTNRLSFKEMLQVIARVRGLRRLFIPVPVMSRRLAGYITGLLTPVPTTLAIPLAEGLVHPLVADTTKAEREFPQVKPIEYSKAVQLALGKEQRGEVETRFSSALGAGPTYELTEWEGLAREIRSQYVEVAPKAVFDSFSRIGGNNGWLVWDWAWRVRGRLDSIIGGPGLRRGRRHPTELLPGEALDFWRVEAVDSPRLLRLRAEMKLPGKAWLQWEAVPEEQGTRLIQSALFEPSGVIGVIYWYSLYPVHQFIFSDMVRAIAKQSLILSAGSSGNPDS